MASWDVRDRQTTDQEGMGGKKEGQDEDCFCFYRGLTTAKTLMIVTEKEAEKRRHLSMRERKRITKKN